MKSSSGVFSMRLAGAVPALLLAWAAPVGAQSDTTADAAILMQAIDSARQNPELTDPVDAIIKSMLVKGPAEPGWQQGGIDIGATIAALPGGTNANFIYEASESSSVITVLSNAELPLPEGFVTYVLKADIEGDPDDRGYIAVLPGIWLETSNWVQQLGNARCYPGKFNVSLHAAKPLSEWTLEELGTVMMIYHVGVRMAEIETCTVYSAAADGTYSWRVFSPDGRPFTSLNAEAGASGIVSADRFAAIIAGEE